MLNLALFIEGDLSPEELIGLDKAKIERAAYRAINETADFARRESADLVGKEISFPASYLEPKSNRLRVAHRAGPNSLEAIITARQQATSLARFVVGNPKGKGEVQVQVEPGRTKTIRKAFLLSLRAGSGGIDTVRNQGLAIRVDKGTKPSKAYKPVQIADGLFLLYGPSVDQVFKLVRSDVTPEAEKRLAASFSRLIDLERNS